MAIDATVPVWALGTGRMGAAMATSDRRGGVGVGLELDYVEEAPLAGTGDVLQSTASPTSASRDVVS